MNPFINLNPGLSSYGNLFDESSSTSSIPKYLPATNRKSNCKNILVPSKNFKTLKEVKSKLQAYFQSHRTNQMVQDSFTYFKIGLIELMQKCVPKGNPIECNAFMFQALTRQFQEWEQLKEEFDKKPQVKQITQKETSSEVIVIHEKNMENTILVFQSENVKVYCHSSSSEKEAVKVFLNGAKHKLQKEFEVTRNIHHPGIRKVNEKKNFENKPALFMEWVDGVTINEHGKFSVPEFLDFSREILSALVALHSHDITHNNLSADNIIMNKESKTIKLIGFGCASRFYVNTSYVNQDLVGVDSRFASPERFRRMNSFVDFRSDFYSVGILFYLMLTGKHPFYSIDNWELMRKHLFDLAQPVHLVDDEIPIPISKLVSKLMEKKVNDRYQSAKGVLHDLEWMKSEFITDSKLKSICLSAHDYSEHILISQKLHGRDLEKCVLLSAFDNAMKGGFEIALVKGKTGSGKSSLVLELYKTVIEVNGNFIIGKFDQSHSSVPYSAMKQACENLCDLLLKENEETLSRNRRMIQEAVGDEGKLLTDVIKNLHLIIGPQPNVNEAIGKESLNRFNYVFCKFLNVVCSSQHPLVMFIDDLQWADNGSLILLSLLMTNKDIDYMLFVGAYRNNEIDESHPLSVMIKNMKEKRVSMHDIETPNLSMSNVNELISDALHTSQVETYPLTALVVRKTHGNPFFVEQFLRSLSDKKLVWFSYEKKSWIWDIEQIDKLNITDNVVELLIQKMLCLNVPTQNCLKIASCIGSPFSLSTIKLACPDYHNLESAISEGLIVLVFSSSCKKYQFAHDQIQLAASSLIPENDMNSTHFQIGHTIWKKSNDEQLEENLFLVVKLLNSDLNAFIDPNECKDIAKLNLKAGEKANMSTSHELASWYLATGIEWLNKTSFQKNNSTLFLHLHKALSEAYFCLRKYELMEKMIGEVMKNTSSILEVITLISLRIRAFTDQALFKESIEASLEIFEELGESFPKSPDNKLIQSEFHHVQSLLQNKSNDEITKRTTTNETILAVMEISVVSCVASYLSGSKYFPLFVLRNVQLSLIHGVSKWSSDSFASYGCLCGEFKEIREGFRFGQLALFLLDKFETKHSLPKVYASVFISVNPWMKHLHNSLNHLMDAYRVSLEVGAHDYGIFCFIGFCMYSLLSGKPLEKLNETIGSVDNTISKKGFVYITCQFAVRKFLGINTP